MKIYGVKLVNDEKELDVLCNFFESVGKLSWPYPWDIAVKSNHKKSWLYILEKMYDEDDEPVFAFSLPPWSP